MERKKRLGSRLVSFALFLCLALGQLLLFPIRAEDTPGDQAAEPIEQAPEDTTFFRTDFSGFTFSPSSGATNRWNKISNLTSESALAPGEDGNRVQSFKLKSSSGKAMKNVFNTENTLVIAFDLYIAEGLTSFNVSLVDGKPFLSLTYDEGHGVFNVASFDRSLGTLARGGWARFTLIAEPGETEHSLSLRMDRPDGTFTTAAATQKLSTTPSLWINAAGAVDDLFYLDDFAIFSPVDPTAGDLALTNYGDTARNIRLDGPFTVKISHELKPESLVSENVSLSDFEGNPHPVTVILDPIHPTILTVTFPDEVLATYTGYLLTIEGLCDVLDVELPPLSYSFETGGTENALPRRLDPIPAPEGGYVMPDEYNTGHITPYEELVDFALKYPKVEIANGYIQLNNKAVKTYGNVFEGFRAEGLTISVSATTPITIRDFYLDAGGHYYGITNSGCPMVTVTDGEGTGSISAFVSISNARFERMFIHDVRADHLKCGSNTTFISCYIRDGGTRTPGAHADGIQISGNSSAFVNNVRILGCRFDVPTMLYDHVANACIFIKSENGTVGISNLQISDNWLNGGGYTVYLTTGYVGADGMLNIVYTGNRLGCGYTFGPLNCGTFNEGELTRTDNVNISGLEVGSTRFLDPDGKRVSSFSPVDGTIGVSVNVANYTTLAQSYSLRLTLTDKNGVVIAEQSTSGSVRRYVPPKEYTAASNQEKVTITNSDGTTTEVSQLIEKPDLPRNVDLSLSDFDISRAAKGDTLTVSLYDGRGNLLSSSSIESTDDPDPAAVAALTLLPGAMAKISDPSSLRFVGQMDLDTIVRMETLWGAGCYSLSLTLTREGEDPIVLPVDKTSDKNGVRYFAFTTDALSDPAKAYAATLTVTVTREGKEPVTVTAPTAPDGGNTRSVKAVAQAALSDLQPSPGAGHTFATQGGYSPYTDAERATLSTLAQ